MGDVRSETPLFPRPPFSHNQSTVIIETLLSHNLGIAIFNAANVLFHHKCEICLEGKRGKVVARAF